jgi:hypothetical protein
MTSTNGPPIRQRVRNLENGWRIRESYGELVRRFDVHDGTGWRDFSWQDLESKTTWILKGDDGRARLATLGLSQWSGNGPAVPAERGCVQCHSGKITPAKIDDPEVQGALLMHLVALDGYRGKQTPAPKPAQIIEGQRGPAGPTGPTGPAGPQGPPGKVDDSEVSKLLSRISRLEQLVSELEAQRAKAGPTGPQGETGPGGKKPTEEELLALIESVVDERKKDLRGPQGAKGEFGTVNVLVKWADGKVIGRQTGAASGGTVTVFLDKLEVARRLAAEEK